MAVVSIAFSAQTKRMVRSYPTLLDEAPSVATSLDGSQSGLFQHGYSSAPHPFLLARNVSKTQYENFEAKRRGTKTKRSCLCKGDYGLKY